ncbi:hypothetical protein VKT23_020025 [Stygiomarasmius scandens]|uniref:Uncharacterized protein n=1 Tax=Marasmiellus scandens TaxID=2682957 RepID=A0ABR1IJV5_9AGAR
MASWPGFPEDILNPLPFIHSEWIGQGRLYKDVPMTVINARADALAVPYSVKASYPPPNLAVTKYVAIPFPQQPYSLITTKERAWFSTHEPTVSEDKCWSLIWNRSIPPQTVLNDLEAAFGQNWFDGAQSLVDPRYQKTTYYLPLYVLSLWKDISNYRQIQQTWKESITAARRTVDDPSVSNFYPMLDSVISSMGCRCPHRWFHLPIP